MAENKDKTIKIGKSTLRYATEEEIQNWQPELKPTELAEPGSAASMQKKDSDELPDLSMAVRNALDNYSGLADPDEPMITSPAERELLEQQRAAEGPAGRRVLGNIGSVGGGIAGATGAAVATPSSGGTSLVASPLIVGEASYIGKRALQAIYDWAYDYDPYTDDKYIYNIIQEIGGKNSAIAAQQGASIDDMAMSLGYDILSGEGLLGEIGWSYAGEGAGAAVKGLAKVPYIGVPLRKAGEFITGSAGKVVGKNVTETEVVTPSEGSSYIKNLAMKGRKPKVTPDEVVGMQSGKLPNMPYIAATEAETLQAKITEGLVARSEPVRNALEASERAILPTAIKTRNELLSGVKERIAAESVDLPKAIRETSQQYTDSIINSTMTDLIDITPISMSTQAKNKYIKDVMQEAENSYYELFRTQKDAILDGDILGATVTPTNIRGHETLNDAIEALNRKYGAYPEKIDTPEGIKQLSGAEKAVTEVAKKAEGTPMQIATKILSELNEQETAKMMAGAITETQFTTLDDLIKLRSNFGKVAFKKGKSQASDYSRDLYALLSEAEESAIREAYIESAGGIAQQADDVLLSAVETANKKVAEYRAIKAELARNLDGKNQTIIKEILNNPEIDGAVRDSYLSEMLNAGQVEKSELYKWAKQAGKGNEVRNALKLHQDELSMNQLRVKMDDWITGNYESVTTAIEKDWISSESILKKAGITENGKNDLVRFMEIAKRASGTGLKLAAAPSALKRAGYLITGSALGLTSLIKPSSIIPITVIGIGGSIHAKKIAIAMASNPTIKKTLLKQLNGKQLKDLDNFGTVLYKALIESNVTGFTEQELEEIRKIGNSTIRTLKENENE